MRLRPADLEIAPGPRPGERAYFVLKQPTDMYWRQEERIVGDAGDLFSVRDGARVYSEVVTHPERIQFIDAMTYRELVATRDEEIERLRAEAEAARLRVEAEAE